MAVAVEVGFAAVLDTIVVAPVWSAPPASIPRMACTHAMTIDPPYSLVQAFLGVQGAVRVSVLGIHWRRHDSWETWANLAHDEAGGDRWQFWEYIVNQAPKYWVFAWEPLSHEFSFRVAILVDVQLRWLEILSCETQARWAIGRTSKEPQRQTEVLPMHCALFEIMRVPGTDLGQLPLDMVPGHRRGLPARGDAAFYGSWYCDLGPSTQEGIFTYRLGFSDGYSLLGWRMELRAGRRNASARLFEWVLAQARIEVRVPGTDLDPPPLLLHAIKM